MPVSADTLQMLMAAGVQGEQLVAVVRAIDADMAATVVVAADTAAERRRAWDRERKRTKRETSGGSPVEYPPESLRTEPAKESPPDPQKKEPPLEGTPPTGATPLYPPQTKLRKAHRLPEDWQPAFDPVEYAIADAKKREKRPLTEIEVIDQIERMRNWARQVGDGKGLKKDWNSALRNWLKDATDRKNDRQSKPAYGISDKQSTSAGFDALDAEIAGRGYGGEAAGLDFDAPPTRRLHVVDPGR